MNAGRILAERMDRDDPLGVFRERFHIPKRGNGEEEIYFCGNSLGLQPKSVSRYVQEVLDAWAQMGVRGHFGGDHPWAPYHEFATEKLARLMGALPLEVVAMNSLTANLHLLMVSFYRPTPERHKILIEAQAFPSDRYAIKSQIRFHGLDPDESLMEATARPGEPTIRTDDFLEFIEREGESIALILWPGVQFYTGQAFPLKKITEAGHRKGSVVGFDLAHAAGNLVLGLHDSQADFAVWCSYKYLNAGPGAVAGCFVHERHAKRFDLPRFVGWWGHDKSTRFSMPHSINLLPGAEGWQLSNPPILSLAPLLASLKLFDEVGMEALRCKSEKLTGYLQRLLIERCGDKVTILTPLEPAEKGCQLSIKLKDGKRIHEWLLASGIACDWREPDVIRLAPVPLYNRFMEVYEFVDRLQRMLQHA